MKDIYCACVSVGAAAAPPGGETYSLSCCSATRAGNPLVGEFSFMSLKQESLPRHSAGTAKLSVKRGLDADCGSGGRLHVG